MRQMQRLPSAFMTREKSPFLLRRKSMLRRVWPACRVSGTSQRVIRSKGRVQNLGNTAWFSQMAAMRFWMASSWLCSAVFTFSSWLLSTNWVTAVSQKMRLYWSCRNWSLAMLSLTSMWQQSLCSGLTRELMMAPPRYLFSTELNISSWPTWSCRFSNRAPQLSLVTGSLSFLNLTSRSFCMKYFSSSWGTAKSPQTAHMVPEGNSWAMTATSKLNSLLLSGTEGLQLLFTQLFNTFLRSRSQHWLLWKLQFERANTCTEKAFTPVGMFSPLLFSSIFFSLTLNLLCSALIAIWEQSLLLTNTSTFLRPLSFMALKSTSLWRMFFSHLNLISSCWLSESRKPSKVWQKLEMSTFSVFSKGWAHISRASWVVLPSKTGWALLKLFWLVNQVVSKSSLGKQLITFSRSSNDAFPVLVATRTEHRPSSRLIPTKKWKEKRILLLFMLRLLRQAERPRMLREVEEHLLNSRRAHSLSLLCTVAMAESLPCRYFMSTIFFSISTLASSFLTTTSQYCLSDDSSFFLGSFSSLSSMSQSILFFMSIFTIFLFSSFFAFSISRLILGRLILGILGRLILGRLILGRLISGILGRLILGILGIQILGNLGKNFFFNQFPNPLRQLLRRVSLGTGAPWTVAVEASNSNSSAIKWCFFITRFVYDYNLFCVRYEGEQAMTNIYNTQQAIQIKRYHYYRMRSLQYIRQGVSKCPFLMSKVEAQVLPSAAMQVMEEKVCKLSQSQCTKEESACPYLRLLQATQPCPSSAPTQQHPPNEQAVKAAYDHQFQVAVNKVKQQKRYRVFANIKRKVGHFPKATLTTASGEEKEVTVWCSNDYLGMGQNPEVLQALTETALALGSGSGGTRNIGGNSGFHSELEGELASLHGQGSALVTSSCFVANQAAMVALAQVLEDVVFLSDRQNHASLIEGIRNSRADKVIFAHNDLADLEKALQRVAHRKNKVIVFESVYSMSGSVAPMKEICDLAVKYKALTFVDEVHAVGLYGNSGAGLGEVLGIQERLDFVSGTLSKGYGVFGGYVAGRPQAIDCIRSYASNYIFTTSLPPAVVAAALASVRYLRRNQAERLRLHHVAQQVKRRLAEVGIPVVQGHSHIVPVLVGDPEKCRLASEMLLSDFNLYLQPINYPTVPMGQELLRVSPTPNHDSHMVEHLVQSLSQVFSRLGLLQPRRPALDRQLASHYHLQEQPGEGQPLF